MESHDGDDDHDASCGKMTCPPELSGNPTSRVIWEKVGAMNEGVRTLPIQYLRYLKRSLICHKILCHGASDSTSHLKEGVLWIFIAL
jgi:hypothetical protein